MPYTPRNFRHGKLSRVIADGNNLSCYLREASVSTEMPTVDATAFCDSLQQFVTGLPNMTATINGMFEASDAGPDTVILQKFGKDSTYLNLVVANEGLQVGRRVRGLSGIVTSYNLQNSASDLVSVAMNLQGVGELYVMTTLSDYTVNYAPNASAQPMTQFDRGTTGRLGVTAFPGYLYVHAQNKSTNAVTILIKDRTTSGGAARTLSTVTVPAGTVTTPGLFAGLAPSSLVGGGYRIANIDRFIDADITNPAGNANNVNVFIGLVDENLSLIQT